MAHSGCLGSFPEDFIPFANRYPDLSLILAHFGNSSDGNLSRLAYALNQATNSNIYIDTPSSKSIYCGRKYHFH